MKTKTEVVRRPNRKERRALAILFDKQSERKPNAAKRKILEAMFSAKH